MARGRMVSTTIATDKRLALLSINAEYVYLKTIPHLDRDGLILGDASVLWAKVAPRRPELLPETENCIREWIKQDLVLAYETSDGIALYFPGFIKNQVGMRYEREPESTIQVPPGYERTPSGLVPTSKQQASGTLPEIIRQSSGSYPAEVKLKEVKSKEKKEEMLPISADVDHRPPDSALQRKQEQNAQVPPKLRRELADAVLELTGLLKLANSTGSGAQQALDNAHETALTLYGMGYTTPQMISELSETWRGSWQVGKNPTARPTVKQVLELASRPISTGNGDTPKAFTVMYPDGTSKQVGNE